MRKELAFALLWLLAAGVGLIYAGVSGLLGYRRRAYIYPFEYGYVTSGVNYGSIPLGIMATSWAILLILPLAEAWHTGCLLTSSLLGVLGVLLGMLQPKFMMPKWYRWLKENHADVLPLLREDVREVGYDIWRKRTDTQEGLEAWVEEVRQKHGVEKPVAIWKIEES